MAALLIPETRFYVGYLHIFLAGSVDPVIVSIVLGRSRLDGLFTHLAVQAVEGGREIPRLKYTTQQSKFAVNTSSFGAWCGY